MITGLIIGVVVTAIVAVVAFVAVMLSGHRP